MSRQKANYRREYFGFAPKQFHDLSAKLFESVHSDDLFQFSISFDALSEYHEEVLDLMIIRKAIDNRLGYLEKLHDYDTKTTLFI